MSTLDVVADVLREVAPRALKAREIAAWAGSRLPTASKTPETVVSRDLAMDVKARGAASRFLRVDRGAFVLKEALPTALYCDTDPYAAQWTRNLIEAGQLAPGVVDERSIRDLKPADVASFRQFHAFSGIGVWSRALRDAGFPDNANVWTGSCPCQGWSQAGRKKGFKDPRHLWPEWFRLIKACRPSLLFSEQVASKDGRAWLDVVFDDLERAGYVCQTYDLPACGFGAPHRRQRLYIVAYSSDRGREILSSSWIHDRRQRGHDAARCGETDSRVSCSASDAERDDVGISEHEVVRGAADLARNGSLRPGDRIRIDGDPGWGGAVGGFWARDVEWIYCRPAPGHQDGCWRPVEFGTQPLAHGTSPDLGRTRTARLRGFGNSIVLPQATAFVEAVIDSCAEAAREMTSTSTAEAVT